MNEEGINIGLPDVFQEAFESRFWAGISIQAKRLMGQLRTRGIHDITFTPHLKSLISPILFRDIITSLVQYLLKIAFHIILPGPATF